MRLLLAGVAVLAAMTGCAHVDAEPDSGTLTWPTVQLVASYTIRSNPLWQPAYTVIEPPRALVYSDGTVIADASRKLTLNNKELSGLVRALRRELDGLGPFARANTKVLDGNTTDLRVRMANGDLYSVSAYALGDRHPRRLRDAHARLEALRARVAAEGTAYTSDRVRFVASPVSDTPANLAPWPAGVAVPPISDLGAGAYGEVRSADLTGEAGAQVIAGLPGVPRLWERWPVVRSPDDDEVLFSVAWRYLTPDE
jgi:hypothetical protein